MDSATELEIVSPSLLYLRKWAVTAGRCSLQAAAAQSWRVPGVWWGAVRAILLDVHTKEAHIHSINLLKGKQSFGTVREGLWHLTRIHKSAGNRGKNNNKAIIKPVFYQNKEIPSTLFLTH